VKKLLFHALVPLNTLLLFLIIFENKLVIPSWLQVVGRMHPMILHFPIVLLILTALIVLFAPAGALRQNLFDYLLLFTSLSAVLTALMGFFLSVGGDYPSETISWHKWTGIAIPFILLIICVFREQLYSRLLVFKIIAVAISALIIVAGHFGSTLTHGKNFVLAPVSDDNENKLPPFDDALVFADLVQPILEAKCISCHNSAKAKGQLIMETKAMLIQGGKGGRPWDSAKADLGIMMRRIHLPADQKKHMPPAGKPQLDPEEMTIMESWIRQGSDFGKKISSLSSTDSLYMIAKKKFGSASEEIYTFPPADEKEMARLSNSNRIITSIAEGSPALSVHFFNRGNFSNAAVDELAPLKDNIIDLSFVNMPFTDELLAHLRQFKQLRKLNLSATKITGKNFSELTSLPALKSLSLSGNGITPDHLTHIGTFPSLQQIYLWNTSVAQKDLPALEKEHRKVIFNLGFTGDSTIIQLSPPMLAADQDIFREELTINIRHFIQGTSIRYTLDGTEPDSIHAQEYKGGLIIKKNTMLKAKAYKKGWISSEVVRHYYFQKTFKPDSAELVTKTKDRTEIKNAHLLIDEEKSDINYTNGKWMSFSGKPMECFLFFNAPVKASNLTIGILKDISAAIMPPQKVEVWGGMDQHHLRLLTGYNPVQPRQMEYREILPVECNFAPTELRVIKIVAWPLDKLPEWHQNKGNAGSLFVDEVFVN
jgi:uncharacterized membrane protein